MHYPVHLVALLLWGLSVLSCTDADRTNPLDGSSVTLFVPKVNHPVGGEQWFPGTFQEIRWSPASQILDKTVTIQLVCGSDTTMVADDVPNSGSFIWQVPDRPYPSCRIRIIGSAGASESPGSFRIKAKPILERMNIGPQGGWEPAALRELIIFTSDRDDPDGELYLFDRETESVTRLTRKPRFDGEAAWFKPLGKLFAYTSTDSSGDKNIFMMTTEGPQAGFPIQVTTTGGEQPAWQNLPPLSTNAFANGNPALAYKQSVLSVYGQLIAVTLDTRIITLPVITLPLTFITPPRRLLPSVDEPQIQIGAPTWMVLNSGNALIYDAGGSVSHLFRADFPGQLYTPVIKNPIGLLAEVRSPMNPSLSPNGDYIAFSANGEIWISPLNGVVATQLTRTLGTNLTDNFPDWASDTEIVFQRRQDGSLHWEIWTVQVQEFP